MPAVAIFSKRSFEAIRQSVVAETAFVKTSLSKPHATTLRTLFIESHLLFYQAQQSAVGRQTDDFVQCKLFSQLVLFQSNYMPV